MSAEPTTTQPGGRSTWTPSERILKLLNDHNSTPPYLGSERAIHYTDFDKKDALKYSSTVIRRAQSLAYHLRSRTIRIYDDEIIVGSHTERRVGAICQAEMAGAFMLDEVYKLEKRAVNPLKVGRGDKRTLLFKVLPHWLFRSMPSKSFPFFQFLKYATEQLNAVFFIVNEIGGVAHFLPDYEDLIKLGTNGLRRKVGTAFQNISPLTKDKKESLEANLIALDALENFAERYRALAETTGRNDVAEVLSAVPKNPAANLREALQMIWFFQMIIQIESMEQGISLGRIDQYLYPLYLKEKEEGVFDENDFKDALCAFCVKLSEVIPFFSSKITEYFAGLPSGQAATIGGINEKGEDAANELSFMILDVIDKFKTRQPNWHARISKDSKPGFVKAVMNVVSKGGGSPALYNDDVIMPAMRKRGFSTDKLWNYATVGCVEPALPGESFTSSDAAIFNMPVILETLFGGGYRLGQKLKFGLGKMKRNKKALDSIKNMEELMEELKAEMETQVDYLKYCLDHIEKANADYFPVPFSSLTVKGCVESGVDLTRGGALFNASGVQGVGVADLADSMAAIEELVFKKKEYSLEEIARACKDNFKGHEILRAKLLKAPKFGNNDERVDGVASRLTRVFDDLISKNVNTRGGRWMPGFYSMTCHQGMGKNTSALPSGRLKGESLANGLAPADGVDLLGPTALLNSVASLDHEIFGNGINLNLKFESETLRGENSDDILDALIGGYFDQGGMQAQVNVLDPDVLREARLRPEKHRNLLVRVSGYCSYFTDLTPELQDEIIRRASQQI